jgi:light-regulated signal transduction histidine kinase (bacteriophytochrome)
MGKPRCTEPAREELETLREQLRLANVELDKVKHQLGVQAEDLDAFTHSVAHDLRTPLVSLSGLSSMLLKEYSDKLDDEGKQWLELIRESVAQMHGLIDGLVRLSRVAKGAIQSEPVDLSELARQIAASLALQEPGRQVEFVIAQGLSANGDPPLLRTVLENLLGNAWKFTGRKEAARIEFGVVAHEGKPAFFVRDNGAGFRATQTHRLFEIFQRLHSRDDFPGDGCGLAIVRRIVQRHGGRAWAEGEVGQGATFFFQLP